MLAAILIFRWRDGGLEVGWFGLPILVGLILLLCAEFERWISGRKP